MSAYKQFFTKALKKFGIKSINDITPEKKKQFFNYIDKNWKGKNESVTEKMDPVLMKALQKQHNQIYKLLANYRTDPDTKVMVKNWMIGLHKSLKSLGLMKENMYDDSQKQLAISRIGMFEDAIKKSIKSIAIRDKKKATEIMRLYKKHIIEFKLGVQKVLN
jgi:hypothetical protein|tara:strand:- start:334 stop:819 length:486 start_codon:yes stop_codon:yes gene_type:complete